MENLFKRDHVLFIDHSTINENLHYSYYSETPVNPTQLSLAFIAFKVKALIVPQRSIAVCHHIVHLTPAGHH